ncbi:MULTISPECIES: carbon-nitrogen hydrolase family protein [Thalassolituus]|jgi:nitrilase|uniref:carbon-nitrogen hydrolase family protein n=1 Tax=Thalassolituus TaxID=187492 RepID=UPI000C4ADE28|nr:MULTISPECIES: carbon-nitrogen hydrolase family protein [Thalassolituus]MAX87987.1 amidohydrolase [Oceanospirillaceae bacterium]MEC9254762.1 carbon-nitrogen hydrolase family protein [Pseudomonadota bacterium]MEE3210075.1 carbon-nitrogen hydrolase family protein [Pseudomonadota bacterium]|tara:strand:- start:4487 stop:5278 length:792 start_codon:yes stop_codon:yes gene_type:complete
MTGRIAAVQCTSVSDPEKNKRALSVLISEAASQNADLVLLPEMCLSMNSDYYQELAEDSATLDWLAAQAATHSLWLVAGAVPQPAPGDDARVRSASLVFNPEGELVKRYDKIHLFDVDVGDAQGSYRESDTFSSGSDIVNIETPVGNIGLTICFDLRFPEQYQALRDAGADIILVPAAFTHTTGEAHWEILLKARAIETQCYVLAANQCGWHDDKRRTWGHSMIIDPWGESLGMLHESPGVIVADVDLKVLEDLRKKMPLTRP